MQDCIIERSTGIALPLRVDTGEVLVGSAVRCMLGRCDYARARAYAVGLYVEESPFLEEWRSKHAASADSGTPAAGSSDAAARSELLESAGAPGEPARRLVLVMARDVGGGHIAHGFDRSLINRVRAAQGGRNRQGEGKKALKQFTAQFAAIPVLREAAELHIVVKDGTVSTLLDGTTLSVIPSPDLAKAVMGAYLDDKSVFLKYKNTAFIWR